MNEQQSSVSEEDLHAYADGVLPEVRRMQVELALEQNPELAAQVKDYFALNRLLHSRYDPVLDESVPKRLQPPQQLPAGHRWRWREATNWPQLAGMAATLVLGIGIGIGIQTAAPPAGLMAGKPDTMGVSAEGPERFAYQAALAHVVYMPDVVRPDHLGADHEQDFVQWLANRLGTNVHPPVLINLGFELVGGRLLQDAAGGVAQFMYRDAKGERITLYISHRKVSADRTAFKLYRDGSVNVFYWMDRDFGYAVSGGIDRKILLQLSHDVYAQLTPSRAN
ncbi:transcriptional regulator [Burkholderiaceae bacterium 16]|nr:transcriptional regulator [Burkholderiaceae bacterium 16]